MYLVKDHLLVKHKIRSVKDMTGPCGLVGDPEGPVLLAKSRLFTATNEEELAAELAQDIMAGQLNKVKGYFAFYQIDESKNQIRFGSFVTA